MTDEKKNLLLTQVAEEIQHARAHKQGKITSWQKNEDFYYAKKQKSEDSRANVELGRMQEFVHTLLSKVDDPLLFEFEKRKPSQQRRVARLNALRLFDRDRDDWDMKDIVGKKQAIIYGRAIYNYSASSLNGYEAHLDNIDVYDFLIDPTAGGLDLEKANYVGRYGVVKSRQELKKIAEGRSKSKYEKSWIKGLIEGTGNSYEMTEEQRNKENREAAIYKNRKTSFLTEEDKFVFWEWYTTFEGERYYVLFTERGNQAIRIVPLKEMFESNLWPFWSFAAFPDLTEFWTPSYCDYVREIFMAQSVSINQMIDNAEQINKPMKFVSANAITDKSQLKYRKNGYVDVAAGVNPDQAIKIVQTPPIETPIKVYGVLESIQERASGITAAAAGVEDTQGRATIYEGNVANVSDRFGLFNKSYKHGHRRFAKLYEYGVREHLTRRVAVQLLGPDGMDLEMINRNDIFRKGDIFGVIVTSTNAEMQMSENKKRGQAAYFASLVNNPIVNQKEVVQELGNLTGVEQDTIRRLLDTTDVGDTDLMSEASRDVEDLLDGKEVMPNRRANVVYKQYIVNYMDDHFPGRTNGMDAEQFDRLARYVAQLDEIVVANTIRKAQDEGRKMMLAQGTEGSGMVPPGPAQPLQDVIQQNAQV
jgi:hypothetical protein